MSWIKVGPGSPFVPLLRLIYAITEPILGPIRRVLPKTGMFDFSPIVALLLLDLIRRMIEKVLGLLRPAISQADVDGLSLLMQTCC